MHTPPPRPLSSKSLAIDRNRFNKKRQSSRDISEIRKFYRNRIVDELVDKRISLDIRETGTERNRILHLNEFPRSQCYPHHKFANPASETKSILSKSNKRENDIGSQIVYPLHNDSSNHGHNISFLTEEGINIVDDCSDELVGLSFLDDN